MAANVVERTKSSGYEKIEGTVDDDAYIINDISNSWTVIEDGGDAVGSDSDTLTINNASSDKIMLFFDFGLTASTDADYNASIDDGLYVLQKSSMTSVLTSLLSGSNPKSGGIDIGYFFGDTNNYQTENEMGTNYGRDYMETVMLVDKNGVKKILDVQATVEAVKSKVTDYLTGTSYSTVMEYLEDDSVSYKEKVNFLTECYMNVELVTELAPGSIDIEYDAKGNIKLIDFTNVDPENLYIGIGSNNKMEMTGIKQGNNLIFRYSNDETNPDTICLTNFFKTSSTDIQIKFKDADGITYEGNIQELVTIDFFYWDAEKGQKITGTFLNDLIDGSDYADTIHGGAGNDNIYGGLGNDKLYGDSGDNVFEFDTNQIDEGVFEGDGKDIIYSGKGNDLITFGGVWIPTDDVEGTRPLTIDDLKISVKSNSLVIYYTDNDSVELYNYFKLNGEHSVKEVEVYSSDGQELTKYTIEELIAMFPNEISGIENKKNSIKGTVLNDVITGGNLADTIKSGKGNDTITGGTGNDKLYGEYGNNTFYFSSGDGNDTIYSGKGNDTIVLNDTDTIDLYKKGNSLVIKQGEDSVELYNYLKNKTNSADTIVLKDGSEYSLSDLLNNSSTDTTYINVTGNENKSNTLRGTKYANKIVGGNKKDTIYGGSNDDMIWGGLGNDKLYGGTGQNYFYFNAGDGKDTIYSNKGEDEILLSDVNKEDVVLTKSGNNLILQYTEDDSITISNYFKKNAACSVETISFADSESAEDFDAFVSANELEYAKKVNYSKSSEAQNIEGTRLNDSLTGSKGDDTISGGRGHDTIKGGKGNDTITGGTGNDKLYGQYGDNTFCFAAGDGNDTVYSGKGNDTLEFASTSISDIHYEKSGNHLIIKYGEDDTVTLSNYFSTKNNSVDTISAGGQTVSLADDIVIKGVYDSAMDIFQDGYYYSGYKYAGNDYNNIIVANNSKKLNFALAGAGDDIIYCQGKTVIANGGEDNDTYIVSSLKNSTVIEDTSGDNDVIQISDKSSNVNILFDVSVSEGTAVETDMILINKSTLSSLVKTGNIESVSSGIEILNFFNEDGSIGDGAVERIETTTGYITSDEINKVKEEVASWLTENSFTSSMEALGSGSKDQINALLAIYQDIDWQPLA